MRDDAFRCFDRLGFPTTRLEEWRFTNVAPIVDSRTSIMMGIGPGSSRPPSAQPESRPRASAEADSGHTGAGAATYPAWASRLWNQEVSVAWKSSLPARCATT